MSAGRPRRTAAAAAALALSVALGGCVHPRPTPVEVDQPFQLALDAAARTSDGVQVRYDALLEDSRCPIGAQCVWAGTVRVAVTLRAGDVQRVDTLDLTRKPRSAPIGGHTVRLAEFSPGPPHVGEEHPPASETIATFVVERAAP